MKKRSVARRLFPALTRLQAHSVAWALHWGALRTLEVSNFINLLAWPLPSPAASFLFGSPSHSVLRHIVPLQVIDHSNSGRNQSLLNLVFQPLLLKSLSVMHFGAGALSVSGHPESSSHQCDQIAISQGFIRFSGVRFHAGGWRSPPVPQTMDWASLTWPGARQHGSEADVSSGSRRSSKGMSSFTH